MDPKFVKFSVKSTQYHKGADGRRRPRYVDGPWKKTPEAAIEGFVAMLKNKGFDEMLVVEVFLSEDYEERKDLSDQLKQALTTAGIKVG